MHAVKNDVIDLDFQIVKKSASELFRVDLPKQLSGLEVSVREWELPNMEVPKIDPDYYFTVEMLRDVMPYLLTGRGQSPYIFGTHGTSKTSSVEQMCARLGLTCLDTDAGASMEVIDLIGQMMPNPHGGFSFCYGILSRAMKEGHVLVINEYDQLPTLEQKALNRIVEDRKFMIVQTGEIIRADEDFRLIFTGNTNNTGSTANFVTAGGGDSSINDRLKFVPSHFLPYEIEEKILLNVIEQECRLLDMDETMITKLKNQLLSNVQIMLKVASKIRVAHEQTKSLECSLSIRSLKEWARTMIQYSGWDATPMISSFETSFMRGIREEEQPIVMKMLKDLIA